MRRGGLALLLVAASRAASAADVELGYGHEAVTGRTPWSERAIAVGWGGFAGRQGLGGDWALTWEAGLLRQGDLYTRTGARVGLRRHF